jgi:hypothetical protein
MVRTISLSISFAFLFALSLPSAAQTTFTERVFVTNSGPTWVTTGDFDRDGLPDIAVAAEVSNSVEIFKNGGNNNYTFVGANSIGGARLVETADFNKDGKLDLAVASDTQPPLVSILTGVGDGTMSPAGSFATTFPVWDLELGDLNGDGAVDIITHECTIDSSSCTVKTYKNDGTGHFTPWQTLIPPGTDTFPAIRHTLAVADFNGDGKLDVIVLELDGFEVFLGHGDGTFAAPTGKSVSGPFGLTYGSFNNTDRSLDIALGRQTPTCTAPPCTSDILDYLNNGAGNLTLRSKTQMFGSNLVAVDVNGDLITDIVGLNLGHFDGNLQYVLGDGHGIFSAAHQLAGPDTGQVVVARDMNLDGRHDLIIPENMPSDVLLEINNNAAVTCAPPGSGSLHAKFCAPAANATVPLTFTVKGSGNSPAGVARIELWVDGKKRTEMWNDQIKATVTVAAGKHRVALVAVDKFGAHSSSGINVTAQ